MRHGRGYRKLGRTTAHRRQLLRNLVSSLFRSESGRICTTVEKAKEAKRVAEKMITLGKREGLHARRLAARYISDRSIVRRLFDDISPSFAGRAGGYTRVLRLGTRAGDGAEIAFLELVGIAEEARRKAKESAAMAKKADKDRSKDAAKAEGPTSEERAERKATARAEAKARRDERREARAKTKPSERTKSARPKTSAPKKIGGGS